MSDLAGVVERHDVDVVAVPLSQCIDDVELTPGRYANAQMAAFGEYCDTQRFRDRALETLTR